MEKQNKEETIAQLNEYLQDLNTEKLMQTKLIKLVAKAYNLQKHKNKETIFTEEEYKQFVTAKASEIVAIEKQIKSFELIANYIKN